MIFYFFIEIFGKLTSTYKIYSIVHFNNKQ